MGWTSHAKIRGHGKDQYKTSSGLVDVSSLGAPEGKRGKSRTFEEICRPSDGSAGYLGRRGIVIETRRVIKQRTDHRLNNQCYPGYKIM